MGKHCVKLCQPLGTLLAKRVVESREHQLCKAYGAAGLYVQSLKSPLSCINKLFREASYGGDAQAEKLGAGSEGDGEDNNASTSPGDVEDDAGTCLSAV